MSSIALRLVCRTQGPSSGVPTTECEADSLLPSEPSVLLARAGAGAGHDSQPITIHAIARTHHPSHSTADTIEPANSSGNRGDVIHHNFVTRALGRGWANEER